MPANVSAPTCNTFPSPATQPIYLNSANRAFPATSKKLTPANNIAAALAHKIGSELFWRMSPAGSGNWIQTSKFIYPKLGIP
jgi:hypothetical protein